MKRISLIVCRFLLVLLFASVYLQASIAEENGNESRRASLKSLRVARRVKVELPDTKVPLTATKKPSAGKQEVLTLKAPVKKQPELSKEMQELRTKVQRCLDYYYKRHESTADHSPWGLMHAMIAYGIDTQVYYNNKKINAVTLLCYNIPCRGQSLFYVENGLLQARQGPGVQGHDGQFLALLAQSKVSRDYPIRVGKKKFTVADLVEYEKRHCYSGTELTFKLIGLMHYLDSDVEWKNDRGETWDLQRLLREELSQSVIGSACGGTHRMMGFSHALRIREKREEEFVGQWKRNRKFVEAYHEYTFKLQNTDGSFSTNFFEGRGTSGDIHDSLEATGHTLEWLAYSLSKEDLQDPRVIKAVNYLTDLLWENRQTAWKIGPKGHALHGLVLYDQRIFGTKPGERRKAK